MSDTTQGTPGSPEQPTGIQEIVEQSKPTQVTPSAPQVAQQPTQPEYTPEQVAQWRKLAEEGQNYKKQYDSLLPEYTRKSQQLAVMVGAQPQQQTQDPLQPYVGWAKQKGYDEESAKPIAEMAYMIARDLSAQSMQQFQFANAGNQIPVIMSQAYAAAPAAMQHQEIQDALRQELNQFAQMGQFDYFNPEFVANRAKQLFFDKGLYNQQPQQKQPIQNPNFPSMWGIPQGPSGHQQQAAAKIDSPVTQGVVSDLKSRYGQNIK